MLRSFKVEVTFPAKYHASLIGKAGAGVQKLRADYDVQFEFPKRDKPDSAKADIITIVGYEAKVNKAKDALLAKLTELEKIASKQIDVDPRVHSRIIGGRGAGIKALQEKYQVRVNFPRDEKSSQITVTGDFDDVEEAANEILNRAEEYVSLFCEFFIAACLTMICSWRRSTSARPRRLPTRPRTRLPSLAPLLRLFVQSCPAWSWSAHRMSLRSSACVVVLGTPPTSLISRLLEARQRRPPLVRLLSHHTKRNIHRASLQACGAPRSKPALSTPGSN